MYKVDNPKTITCAWFYNKSEPSYQYFEKRIKGIGNNGNQLYAIYDIEPISKSKLYIKNIVYNLVICDGTYAEYLDNPNWVLVATAECGLSDIHFRMFSLELADSQKIIGDITIYCNENHEPITPYKTPFYEKTPNTI